MKKETITILDGGMGRELKRRGAPFTQPQWSATSLIESPEMVKDIHKDYIESGAQVITTNNYAVVPFHIGEDLFRIKAEELAKTAGLIARKAVEESGRKVSIAGSVPPLFGSYRPDLFNGKRVEEIAVPLIKGLFPFIDFWLPETQSLIEEAMLIKTLLDKMDGKRPVWISFTLKDDIISDIPKLRSNEPVRDAVKAVADKGADAVLFNCCQPESIESAIKVTFETLDKMGLKNVRIGAYANAFPPQNENAAANSTLNVLRSDLTCEAYLDYARKWQSYGASIIGGCCGIGPEHISVLTKTFS